MFQSHCWHYNEPDDQNKIKIIAIRCINCEKKDLSMNNINTNYKDTINSFVFNTLLHPFCM